MEIYIPPPPSPDAEAAIAVLATVPGPSPWYLQRPGTGVRSTRGALRWHSAGDDAPSAGKSLLIAPGGEVLAVADFQCYVRQLSERRLLVWHAEEEGSGLLIRRHIRFRLVDVERLRPLGDPVAAIKQLGSGTRFVVADGELATAAISTALADGAHELSLPKEMTEVGELLVLAHSTADGRRENHYDEMHLRLWILDASRRTLEIIPQDWFNDGSYDFGYQWVTRVARMPGIDDIVGEGIRLGVFRLDASKRRVSEWLAENIFYHPER
jgi:hypothetical protein